jgi:hypothetical protein
VETLLTEMWSLDASSDEEMTLLSEPPGLEDDSDDESSPELATPHADLLDELDEENAAGAGSGPMPASVAASSHELERPLKRLCRVLSNSDGKPTFYMSPSGPRIVPAFKYDLVEGCEWWQKYLCESTATRRTVCGRQLRPLVVHSLCTGLGTEFFLTEVGWGNRSLAIIEQTKFSF